MKSAEYHKLKPMPAPAVLDRLRCHGCGTILLIEISRDMSSWNPNVRKRMDEYPIQGWRYKSNGHFCTKTCATRFANEIIDS